MALAKLCAVGGFRNACESAHTPWIGYRDGAGLVGAST
ncbi:Uncharacterised protein [Mycobacteroides abscessus subsp. abscessus]|nr:Uncharacterised protein [Mycobacteroides abscessus subsp. abscessus]